MAQFELKIDSVNNRIFVKTIGFPTDEEMEQHVKRIHAGLAQLKPGFAVIADITEMKATTQVAANALQGLLQEYKKRGISQIVRIVSKEVLAKMQLQRITQHVDIPVSHVTTLAEAEALLAGKR